jgi:hypothetical protein
VLDDAPFGFIEPMLGAPVDGGLSLLLSLLYMLLSFFPSILLLLSTGQRLPRNSLSNVLAMLPARMKFNSEGRGLPEAIDQTFVHATLPAHFAKEVPYDDQFPTKNTCTLLA